MEAERLYRFYTESQDNELLFSFKHAVTHERLEQSVELIRQSLGQRPAARRVFAVFVELAQNILFHSYEQRISQENGRAYGVGILEVTEKPDCYQVISGNLVERDAVVRLQNRIDALKSASAGVLKERFLEQRRQPLQGQHAGLGLMMIARRCGGQLDFFIRSHDRDCDFMVITARITKEGEIQDDE